jgi:hypothetical protein
VVGDKVASPRHIGFFGNKNFRFAFLVGALFGDGYFYKYEKNGQRKITLSTDTRNKEFLAHVLDLFSEANGYPTVPNVFPSREYYARVELSIRSWLAKWLMLEEDLFQQRSHTKHLPKEVFEWDRESTIELLRGLWCTDGYCENSKNGTLYATYCTTSPVMADQVEALLRKLGIQVSRRVQTPAGAQPAHLLTVVTERSKKIFCEALGPLFGKSGKYVASTSPNSNYDTLPKEVHAWVRRLREERGTYWQKDNPKTKALAAIKLSSSYSPTYEKITKIANILEEPTLTSLCESDTFWDEIISIEHVGEKETWALQTSNETFISNFIVQHNSTLLANYLITRSIVRPYNKAVYVSPSHLQTRQFSNGKLSPWTQDSPIINKYFIDSSVSSQVFEKGFTNGSLIFLRSAFLNAERVRGLSANELMIDEIQSMLSANIPVIMEVLSHAEDPQVIFAGTPLTMDNYIETMWQSSNQCEWLVPCDAHIPIHWNFLDEKSIGKEYPICNKCGKRIDPSKGKWFAFNNTDDMVGYHMNQIMVPWMQSPTKWKELVWKKEHYSKGQFYNEVLGLSYDSASKPISRFELMRLCSPQHPYRWRPDEVTQNQPVFAGIDWGEGADGTERNFKGRLKTASYTVLTLGMFINPKQFYIFFQKRFKGEEALPRNCVREIIQICKAFNAVMIGSDWGFGWGVNDTIEDVFGPRRVIKFQHNGMQKERQKYDPVGHKVQLNRTEVLTDLFDDLKNQKFIFPPWEQSHDFLVDIEHIYAEFGGVHGLRYDHRPSEPDDAAHSILMCREAARYFYQQY